MIASSRSGREHHPLSFAEYDRVKKAVFVAAGRDRFNEALGSVKVSGKDTNGDLCIFEGYSSPAQNRGWGPLLHVHHQDEWFQAPYRVNKEYGEQVRNTETLFAAS